MRFAISFITAWAIALLAVWAWLALTPDPQPEPPRNLEEHFRRDARQKYGGVVRDDLGEPLKGVRVVPADLPLALRRQAVTSSRGRFQISLPRSAAPRVELTCPGHVRRVVHLVEGDDGDYRLPIGAELRGRVVDDRTESPLAGVRVEIAGNRGWFTEQITDSAGEFITWGPPGPVVVSAHSTDHADGLFVDVVLSFDEPQNLDFPIDPGRQLELAFIGIDDRPLPLANVEMTTDGGDLERARSDARGRVRFIGVGGDTARVSVVLPGYAERYTVLPLAQLPQATTPIRLQAACPWTLDLRSGVDATAPDADPVLGELLIRRGQRLISRSELGDPDARNVLAAGVTYNLDIRALGFPSTRVRFRPEAGAANELHVALRPGHRVSGRVLIDGDPGVGVRILITGRPTAGALGSVEILWSTGDGRFLSPELAAGHYHLGLEHPDARRWSRDLELGAPGAGELGDIEMLDP